MTEQPKHPVPAGWYPDASGSGRRWWDGTAWTAHTDTGLPTVAEVYQTPMAPRTAELVPQSTTAAPLELRHPTELWAPTATSDLQSPPAWHPDPHGSGGLRWWDGMAWTQQLTSGLDSHRLDHRCQHRGREIGRYCFPTDLLLRPVRPVLFVRGGRGDHARGRNVPVHSRVCHVRSRVAAVLVHLGGLHHLGVRRRQ